MSFAETVTFSGVFNFRDVGGARGLDGRQVRRGRLYRSDSLHRLAGDDRERFAALGIRTVLDLRRPHEIERVGRIPDVPGVAYHNIHPVHREWQPTPEPAADAHARYLADRYVDMIDEGAAGLAAALGLIATEGHAPLVVHCHAGKDRTGVLAALTLSLLGVDDAAIAADYASSTSAAAAFGAQARRERPHEQPVPAHFVGSPAEAMVLFLADLRARHGSVELYARSAGFGAAEVMALRAHLLAPAK